MLTTLPFDDLMHECGFADAVEFMRTLRANQFQVKRGRDVPADLANDIVKRLQGRRIDWYSYRQRERDRIDGGPLAHSESIDLLDLAADYWKRLPASSVIAGDRQLIGLVCTGGFLIGADGGPFVLPFNSGLTILLGDRGSGKSTILNLLGVLGSPTDNSDVLVTKLMSILRDDSDRELNRGRRVHSTLRHYGVSQYACFHSHEGQIFCYVSDIDRGQSAFLRLSDGRFQFVEQDIETIELQTLQQGEVFRIADTSNEFFLNGLLDALFPSLENRRQDLVLAVKTHTAMVKHFNPGLRAWNNRFARFVQQRRRELKTLNAAVVRGSLDDDVRRILEAYLTHIQTLDNAQLPMTIWECLAADRNIDKAAFWYLFLARAADYLRREVPAVLRWQTRENELDEEFATLLAEGWVDDDHEPEFDSDDDIIDLTPDSQRARPSREVLADIIKGLRQRLRRLSRWDELFNGRLQWNEQLRALVESYSTSIRTHIDVVKSQEQVCDHVTSLFNRDGTIVRVFTHDSAGLIQFATEELELAAGIPELDLILQSTARADSTKTIEWNLNRYLGATQKLLEWCRRLAFSEEIQQHMFYSPIDIELRQGSEFRPFSQLSFGQKSGIILKMVLSATTKRAVIIDQPEDNLDTNAVVHMLAPALKALGAARQIIIATHSSNLIMGLPDANLVVLESSGAYGRIVTQGSLLTQALTRAVLDILEGGAAAFETKLKTYEQFLQQLTGQIRDMDINAIESTFRRRAIDGLRNFLQPVISDRAMLEFFRHELRQPSRLGAHIRDAKRTLERENSIEGRDEIIGRVRRVLDTLDSHVTKLQATIEEMRMLDTQPRKCQVRLGPLLSRLAEEYVSRFGQAYRRIRIAVDPRLHTEEIHVDPDHLKLVFANLFKNSLRATELRAVNELRPNAPTFQEEVEITLAAADALTVRLTLRDNGRGIPEWVTPKLYHERCSDQVGEGHGLGGIIIRKILDLNGGTIRVARSEPGVGTQQELTLPRSSGKVYA